MSRPNIKEISKSLELLEETSQRKHSRGDHELDWLDTPRKGKRERTGSQPAEGDRVRGPVDGPSAPSCTTLEEDRSSILQGAGFTLTRTQSVSIIPIEKVHQVDSENKDRQSQEDEYSEADAFTTRAGKHIRFHKELVWPRTPRQTKKSRHQGARSGSLEEQISQQEPLEGITLSCRGNIEGTSENYAPRADSHNLGHPEETERQVIEDIAAANTLLPTLEEEYIRNQPDKRARGIFKRMFSRKNRKERSSSVEDEGKLYRSQLTKRKLEYDSVSLPVATEVEMEDHMGAARPSGSEPFSLLPLSQLYREKGKVSGPELATYAEYAKLILESAASHHKEFLRDYLSTLQFMEMERARARPLGVTELDRELVNLPRNTHTTIKMNELVLTPDIFNGEKPKPRRWLTDYSEAIIANGWSDHLAVKYLPTFLSKAAKDWYFTEVRPRLTPDTRWSQVHEMFTNNYFGEADYVELSRAIEKASQRPDEKAANFIPRVRRLLQMLSPDTSEIEIVRKLKEKLRPEYRQLVNLQPQ